MKNKNRNWDMSIEELLRFLSYTMKFDAMVIEAITDKLKEHCIGNAKLPDNAVNKLRKKAWASFWRKQNSPAKLWIGFTWSRSEAKLSTTQKY